MTQVAAWRAAIVLWAIWAFTRGRTFTAASSEGDWLVRDPMTLTGYLTVLAALWLSTFAEGALRRSLQRLRDERILDEGSTPVETLLTALERRSRRVQWVAGAAVGLAVLLGHLAYHRGFGAAVAADGFARAWTIELTLADTLLGCLIGARFGLLAVYGHAADSLRQTSASLTLVPNHPDGIGGTKPISDLLLLEGLPVALVIVWLTLWLILIGAGRPAGLALIYQPWQWPLAGFLALALAFFWFAFLRPLDAWWTLMRSAKDELARAAAGFGGRQLREAMERRRAAASLDDFVRANAALVDGIAVAREVERLPDLPLKTVPGQVFRMAAWWPLLTLLADTLVSGSLGGEGMVESLAAVLRALLT